MRRHSIFLSPAGAGIALICFFLPWVRGSCGPITVEANGVRIGGLFWLVLAAAALTLILFFFFWLRKQIARFRPVAILFGSAAIGVILYKFVGAFGGRPTDLNLSKAGSMIEMGAFGTIGGLLLSIIGAAFFREEKGKETVSPSAPAE